MWNLKIKRRVKLLIVLYFGQVVQVIVTVTLLIASQQLQLTDIPTMMSHVLLASATSYAALVSERVKPPNTKKMSLGPDLAWLRPPGQLYLALALLVE